MKNILILIIVSLFFSGCVKDINNLNGSITQAIEILDQYAVRTNTNSTTNKQSKTQKTKYAKTIKTDVLLINRNAYTGYLVKDGFMYPGDMTKSNSYKSHKDTCEFMGARLLSKTDFNKLFGDYTHYKPITISANNYTNYWLSDKDPEHRGNIFQGNLEHNRVHFISSNPNSLRMNLSKLLCISDVSQKGKKWMDSSYDVLADTLDGDNKDYKREEYHSPLNMHYAGRNMYYKALNYCKKHNARLPLRTEIEDAYKNGSEDFFGKKYFTIEGDIVNTNNIGATGLQHKSSAKSVWVRCITYSKTI